MEKITKKGFKPIDQERKKAIEAARNTLKKDKRINLRLSQKDYHQIQIKAIEEGICNRTIKIRIKLRREGNTALQFFGLQELVK